MDKSPTVRDLIKRYETKSSDTSIQNRLSKSLLSISSTSKNQFEESLTAKNVNYRLDDFKWQTLKHVDEDVKRLQQTLKSRTSEDFIMYVEAQNDIIFMFNELVTLESNNNKRIEEEKIRLSTTLQKIHFEITKPYLQYQTDQIVVEDPKRKSYRKEEVIPQSMLIYKEDTPHSDDNNDSKSYMKHQTNEIVEESATVVDGTPLRKCFRKEEAIPQSPSLVTYKRDARHPDDNNVNNQTKQIVVGATKRKSYCKEEAIPQSPSLVTYKEDARHPDDNNVKNQTNEIVANSATTVDCATKRKSYCKEEVIPQSPSLLIYKEDVRNPNDSFNWKVNVNDLKKLYENKESKTNDTSRIKPNFKIDHKIFVNNQFLNLDGYNKLHNLDNLSSLSSVDYSNDLDDSIYINGNDEVDD